MILFREKVMRSFSDSKVRGAQAVGISQIFGSVCIVFVNLKEN